MSENSKIEWTDHTFNPWIGCTKISQGCANCYAERDMDHRYGKVKWGPQGTRNRTSAAYWRKPVQWNKQHWYECPSCGWRGTSPDHNLAGMFSCPDCDRLYSNKVRQRVFCASLADIFEDRPELIDWRRDLLELIIRTPWLDWLILTKRPENVNRMIEEVTGFSESDMWFHVADNIWIGTSVENQEAADKRIPELLKIPAKVRFLSIEPLLTSIDISEYLPYEYYISSQDLEHHADDGSRWANLDGIHWVIVGGESGPNARPMATNWARSIRDQCQEANVQFFMKQMGGTKKPFREIPDDLLIREYPIVEAKNE